MLTGPSSRLVPSGCRRLQRAIENVVAPRAARPAPGSQCGSLGEVKGVVQWVSVAHAVKATVRILNPLLIDEDDEAPAEAEPVIGDDEDDEAAQPVDSFLAKATQGEPPRGKKTGLFPGPRLRGNWFWRNGRYLPTYPPLSTLWWVSLPEPLSFDLGASEHASEQRRSGRASDCHGRVAREGGSRRPMAGEPGVARHLRQGRGRAELEGSLGEGGERRAKVHRA